MEGGGVLTIKENELYRIPGRKSLFQTLPVLHLAVTLGVKIYGEGG